MRERVSDRTVSSTLNLGLYPYEMIITTIYKDLGNGTYERTTEYSGYPASCGNKELPLTEIVQKKDVPFSVRFKLWFSD